MPTFASSPAFLSAMRTLSTRLGCPLPMPSSRPSLATVMALLFTCFTASHANFRSASCPSVGCASDTTVKSMSAGVRLSAS